MDNKLTLPKISSHRVTTSYDKRIAVNRSPKIKKFNDIFLNREHLNHKGNQLQLSIEERKREKIMRNYKHFDLLTSKSNISNCYQRLINPYDEYFKRLDFLDPLDPNFDMLKVRDDYLKKKLQNQINDKLSIMKVNEEESNFKKFVLNDFLNDRNKNTSQIKVKFFSKHYSEKDKSTINFNNEINLLSSGKTNFSSTSPKEKVKFQVNSTSNIIGKSIGNLESKMIHVSSYNTQSEINFKDMKELKETKDSLNLNYNNIENEVLQSKQELGDLNTNQGMNYYNMTILDEDDEENKKLNKETSSKNIQKMFNEIKSKNNDYLKRMENLAKEKKFEAKSKELTEYNEDLSNKIKENYDIIKQLDSEIMDCTAEIILNQNQINQKTKEFNEYIRRKINLTDEKSSVVVVHKIEENDILREEQAKHNEQVNEISETIKEIEEEIAQLTEEKKIIREKISELQKSIDSKEEELKLIRKQ